MDNNDNNLARIREVLNKSKSIAILLPPNPTNDAVASATGLYLGLLKTGKSVNIACSQKVAGELTASDKIQTNMTSGGDSLMISFPYSDGTIDKVDYNIQGDSFNLIITPRAGFSKLNPNKVKYSYTGGVVDTIVVIDSPTLQSLGQVYTDNQNQFTGKDIINIDRHLTNAYFGTINYVNKSVSSVSELILPVLQSLQVEIDRDMATNLYSGIASSTNNFTSYSTNADTFEHIAALMRFGAIKKLYKKPGLNSQPVVSMPVAQRQKPPTVRNHSPNGPEIAGNVVPIEEVEKEKQPGQQNMEQKNASDWLKPKIFKGGGLI